MFFATIQNAISEKLAQLFKQKGPFKVSITLQVELKKSFTKDGEVFFEFAQPYFNSPTFTIMNESQMKPELEGGEEKIVNGIAKWISKGSGWVIENIRRLFLNIVSYVPLKARSYLPLPEELRSSRKGLINIKNTDNECFRWCHIRHLNPLKHHNERITLKDKEFVKTLDYCGVTFPVSIKDMDKIERQNNININALGYSDGETYTIRISKENYEDTLNVVSIEGEEPDQKHYVLIKDVNRFNFNISKHESKKYFCLHCLQYFHTEYHLEKHKEDCLIINGTQKIEMPAPGSKVYFQNHKNQLAGPFAIYADLEAITKKIDTCSPPGDKSYTQGYQKHEASGFGYKVVCHYDQKYSKPAVIYRGENVIEKFIQYLFEEVKDC